MGLGLKKRHQHRRAKFAQLEPCRADQAKLVICDHTIDITYVRLVAGWLYLVAVLDWYSRYVISWELSDSLEIGFVLRAVDRALEHSTPRIWDSDQGSHFGTVARTALGYNRVTNFIL